MTEHQLQRLKAMVTSPKVDAKLVRIKCADGDVLEGFAEFVDEEYRDVIFQPVSSNNPEKYKKGISYAIDWDDIADVQELLK